QMQTAVWLRSHLQQRGSRQREMAEDELPVVPGPGESSGVAVDAQDRSRDFASALPDQEPPGLFTFAAVVRDFPISVDGGSIRRGRGRSLVRRGRKRIV